MLKDFFECYAQIALFLMIFSLLGHTNFFWNFVFSQQWTHRNTVNIIFFVFGVK